MEIWAFLMFTIMGIIIIYFAFVRPFRKGVQDAREARDWERSLKESNERYKRQQETLTKSFFEKYEAQQKEKIIELLKQQMDKYPPDEQMKIMDSMLKGVMTNERQQSIIKKTPITREDFLQRTYFLWDKADIYGFSKKQIFSRIYGSEYNESDEFERKMIGNPFIFGNISPIKRNSNGNNKWEKEPFFLKVKSLDDHKIEGQTPEGKKIIIFLKDTADYMKLIYSY